jgi:hypothetical protein
MKEITMNILKLSGIAAALLMCTSNSYATENACAVGDTTEIYFVNGVWNTLAQARDGQNILQDAYQTSAQSQYPNQTFEFKLAYNYHASKVRDVIEVIGQKLNEIADEDANTLTAAQYFNLYMTVKSFEDVVPSQARPLTVVIEEYLAGRITEAVTASSHIQKYQTDLQEGKRVLLVAHSQGNLFANQAIAALMDEYGSSIGLLGVASPAALTYNNSPYYTAHDDRVIDALRIIHDVLPSNIENDPGVFNDDRDFSNHQFNSSYLASGLNSRIAIDAGFNAYLENLQFPSAELGSGAITVTLTWGSEPDVDLHVSEPNGSHVYYRNLQGVSGFLDLDDTSGFGPEHYYVSCDTLEVGTYSVGVNYYNGSSAETAHVQVSTADGNTRSFTQVLTDSVGSAGNDSPLLISTINVDQDDHGSYTYSVN